LFSQSYHHNNFSGSRNAPLTIGFVSNPAFTVTVLLMNVLLLFLLWDCATDKKPVALYASGSALLNYYPALLKLSIVRFH
jgi:2-succinyl-5-enolpyruvyl-6-hydroxy-3-cyclohexene-1-carboxylate synthase